MLKIYIKKGDKAIAHELLFEILDREFSLNYSEFDLKKTPYGKYYIENSPLKFNLSHSKDNIVIAISDGEVGVDCEVVKSEFRQRSIFGVMPQTAENYAELWTKAESIVKYNASSILADLKKIDLSSTPTLNGVVVDFNLFTFYKDDLVITVATKENGYSIGD